VGGILQSRRYVSGRFAVRRCDLRERLALQFGAQLVRGNADCGSGRRCIEAAASEAARTAFTAWLLDLVDLLIDALVDRGLVRGCLCRGQFAGRDCLVDTRVRCILQRRRDVSGGLAVRLGNLGQGFAVELCSELIGRDADGGGGGGQVFSETASTATTWAARERAASG
jgi:hypothetical protein